MGNIIYSNIVNKVTKMPIRTLTFINGDEYISIFRFESNSQYSLTPRTKTDSKGRARILGYTFDSEFIVPYNHPLFDIPNLLNFENYPALVENSNDAIIKRSGEVIIDTINYKLKSSTKVIITLGNYTPYYYTDGKTISNCTRSGTTLTIPYGVNKWDPGDSIAINQSNNLQAIPIGTYTINSIDINNNILITVNDAGITSGIEVFVDYAAPDIPDVLNANAGADIELDYYSYTIELKSSDLRSYWDIKISAQIKESRGYEGRPGEVNLDNRNSIQIIL